MAKWVTSTQPGAQLELIPPPPDPAARRYDIPTASDKLTEDGSGVMLVDGTTVYLFKTRFGMRFAKVVEPGGFIFWLQERP